MKVSFKRKIQALQKPDDDSQISIHVKPLLKVKELTTEENMTYKEKQEPPKSLFVTKSCDIENMNFKLACKTEGSNKFQKTTATIPNQVTKPSTSTPFIASDTDTPIKPWSKLKLATLISSSYTSLATSNTSSDDFTSPMQIVSVGNISQKINSDEKKFHMKLHGISTKESNSEKSVEVKRSMKNQGEVKSIGKNHIKYYQSVFDLSPEYSGLPFVKRLKILNERQKLAELEEVLQKRSFSLDSSKSNTTQISEALYRCHSDMTGINSQFLRAYDSSSTTSTNTSTSAKSKNMHHNRLSTVYHGYVPLSPVPHEIFRRRKLKSVLKKCSYEREHEETTSCSFYDPLGKKESHVFCRDFSMEPTIEEYVAGRIQFF